MSNQQNRRARILVVEDQGIVATDIERCLEDGGFEVSGVATSMEDAIREASRSLPDLVLMDIRIKGEADGIDAADHLRRHFGLPIVYLTAHHDWDTMARAKRTEPMAFLLKPFKPAELTSTVEIALNRSRVEQEVLQRERSLLSAMDAIGDAVFTTDSEGRIRFMNRAAEELTGWRQEQVLGCQATDVVRLVNEQETASFSALLKPEGTAKSECSHEYRLLARDGVYHWLTIKAASIGGHGEGSVRVVVMQDVTACKLAAEELLKSKEAAEAGNRAKSRFLANMSHEIRTPMNGVIGMSQLLLDTNLSDEQRHYAEIVCSSGEMLLALINDLLDLSKIEAGKIQLETVDFDLRAMLEGVAEMLALQADRKGLELTCLVAPETPSNVRGDPGRLRQVIVNLAANAVKFTERGEVSIGVELERQDAQRTRLRFSIADTGIGIRKDRAAALFSPFVQADESTTRRFGGTGLGLAISKQLAELMGGEIGFASEEGKGSTFWFTAVLEKQPERLETPSGPGAELGKFKALIVDRSKANRLTVCTLLRSWGCRVREAGDAASALALLGDAARSGDRFDVVFIDQGGPGASGEDLAARIAADPGLRDTVLLLMTAIGEPDSDPRAKSAAPAFAARIRKPILETRLRETLTAALYTQKAAGNAAAPQFSHITPFPGPTKKLARILLAEDNRTNQEVAIAMLDRLGYAASAVSSGAEVVEALKRAAYDLVLMDCEMPELNGCEATRLIRDPATGTLDPKVPIIALTAAAMPGDRAMCLAAGMDDYLSKPVETEEFAEKLAKWLSGRPPAVAPAKPAAACAVDTAAAFDQAGLLKRLMGNQALAETVARGFLEDLPRQLRSLRRHLEDGDATSAHRQAHTLKEAAASVSANGLRAVALEAEQVALRGKLREVTELLPVVEHQVERFKSALENVGWI